MATIKTVLDLDSTKFSAGIDKGTRQFQAAFSGPAMRGAAQSAGASFGEEMSHEIGRKLHRGFGAGELFKGGLAAVLGFSTIEGVVERVKEHFRELREIAKDIARENERGAKAIEALKDFFRTDRQRLEVAKKEYAEKLKQLRATNSELGVLQSDGPTGQIGSDKEIAENRKKAAAIQADLRENLLKQAEIRKRIYEDNAKRAKDIADKEKKDADERLKKEKEISAEKEKQDREAEREHERNMQRLQAEYSQIQDNYENAKGNLGKAGANRDTQMMEFMALGIDEAAGGAGTGTDRARARQIRQLKKRARSIFAAGGQIRDYNGNLMSAKDRGIQLLNQAERLSNYDRFKPSEQDPFGGNELKQAAAELKQAAKDLATVEATVDVVPESPSD